jgi:hypothetical protein
MTRWRAFATRTVKSLKKGVANGNSLFVWRSFATGLNYDLRLGLIKLS